MSENPPSATALAADPTAAFFTTLSQRGRDPLLRDTTGTVRFDLTDGDDTEHWLVSLDHGHADVRPHAGVVAADCVVGTSGRLFAAITRGQANALAAVLRGEMVVDGDLELFVILQRLFPGPGGPGDAGSGGQGDE